MPVNLTHWDAASTPTEAALWSSMEGEGLTPYAWSNHPHDVYAAHTHDYDKVILVAQGSITFILPGTSEQMTLHMGDRLDLPAGTLHAARVGADGVVCFEAHKDL